MALGIWFVNSSDNIRTGALPLVMYSMLYAAFVIATPLTAGAISLGEERQSGIHSWHLTLPVSGGNQWLIKLTMAFLISAVCLLLIPATMAAGGYFLGSDYSRMFGRLVVTFVWIPIAICAFSFWCSSVVKGTMRAILFFIPAAGIILAVAATESWVARSSADLVQSSLQHWIAQFQLNPFTLNLTRPFVPYRMNQFMLPVVLLGVGLTQSYRWFHRQIPDSISWTLDRLRFLCIATVLAVLPQIVFESITNRPSVFLISDVVGALYYVQPVMASPQVPPSIQMTVDDFPRLRPAQSTGMYYPLPGLISDDTRTWLRGATLSLSQDEAARERSNVPASVLRYTLQIHLAHGTNCTFKLVYYPRDSLFGMAEGLHRSDCR